MDALNEILKWTLGFLLIWNAYILIFHRGVPNIKTARTIRQTIISRIQQEIGEKNLTVPTIIDLGSGSGLFTREIAKSIPESHVTGYEISPLPFHRSNLLRKIYKLTNIEYRREDFFSADLKNTNIIIFFQTAYQMAKLSEKLKTNTQPGTLIISNRFQLHGWEPIEVLEAQTKAFKQGKIYIYRTE